MQLYVWITYVNEQNADKSTFSMDLLNAIIGITTNAQIQALYAKQLQMTINARNITEICYVLKTWSLKMQDGKCMTWKCAGPSVRNGKCRKWKWSFKVRPNILREAQFTVTTTVLYQTSSTHYRYFLLKARKLSSWRCCCIFHLWDLGSALVHFCSLTIFWSLFLVDPSKHISFNG